MDGDSSALKEMWYYAAAGETLKPGRVLAKTLLGEPILLGRGRDGAVFALRDICPHRGIPLSCGRFDGREIECSYHGWRFDAGGRCLAIPSLVPGQEFDLARIKVKVYPAREVQGNIWVYFGDDPAGAPAVPIAPDVGERGPDLVECLRFPCTIDHVVVGLVDPAHTAFVHRTWWWRGPHSIHEKAKAFAASPFGFTMLRHAPSRNSNAYKLLGGKSETEIIFQLPSVRIEHFRAGRYTVVNLTAVTPIGATECEVSNAIWWTLPYLTPLKPLLRPFVRAFLRQDREILEMQSRGLKHNPPLLLIDDADTQAKWYHRLKNEYARARAEGRPFVNPVKERVLRFRS